MHDLAERGERIDRITVANELMKQNQLESVDGLSYLGRLTTAAADLRARQLRQDREGQVHAAPHRVRVPETHPPLHHRPGEPERSWRAPRRPSSSSASPARRTRSVNTEQILNKFEGGINVFLDPSKRIKGLSTGFTKFDEMTAGMHEGELIILRPGPSMGKTAWLECRAPRRHEHSGPAPGRRVLARMSADSLLTRMICASALIDQQKFRGRLPESGRAQESCRWNSSSGQAPLYIDDSSGTN
jgi:replicative DNA helicase